QRGQRLRLAVAALLHQRALQLPEVVVAQVGDQPPLVLLTLTHLQRVGDEVAGAVGVEHSAVGDLAFLLAALHVGAIFVEQLANRKALSGVIVLSATRHAAVFQVFAALVVVALGGFGPDLPATEVVNVAANLFAEISARVDRKRIG